MSFQLLFVPNSLWCVVDDRRNLCHKKRFTVEKDTKVVRILDSISVT